MRTRWVAVVSLVALVAASTTMAVEPVKQKAVAGVALVPPGVTMLSNAQFRSVVPRRNALAVGVQLRIKFKCYLQWNPVAPNAAPYLLFVYRGTTPVQTEHLVVHWDLQYCCNGNAGAPTNNFLLYPDQGFPVWGLLPSNYNPPPPDQAIPTCPAYGFMDQ